MTQEEYNEVLTLIREIKKRPNKTCINLINSDHDPERYSENYETDSFSDHTGIQVNIVKDSSLQEIRAAFKKAEGFHDELEAQDKWRLQNPNLWELLKHRVNTNCLD